MRIIELFSSSFLIFPHLSSGTFHIVICLSISHFKLQLIVCVRSVFDFRPVSEKRRRAIAQAGIVHVGQMSNDFSYCYNERAHCLVADFALDFSRHFSTRFCRPTLQSNSSYASSVCGAWWGMIYVEFSLLYHEFNTIVSLPYQFCA